MQEVLFTTEDFVKGVTNIDDNTSSKLLMPAVREAQQIELTETLGDAMMKKLTDILVSGMEDDPANAAYKGLLDSCQYFLAYQAMTNVVVMTAAKVAPAGVEQISDEKMNPVSLSDTFKIRDYYQKKADFYRMHIQTYCWDNRKDLPELCECKIAHIHSNLLTSASSGIYLGGRRGCHKHNVR